MKLQEVPSIPIVFVEESTCEIETAQEVHDSNQTDKLNQTEKKNKIHAHKKELQHLLVFSLSLFVMGLLPYTTPALADYRPWEKGEPIPLVSLLSPSKKVVEDAQGNIEVQHIEEVGGRVLVHW